MSIKTLAAGAALSVLAFGAPALAQTKTMSSGSPKAPIPYSQLDAYMKASPKVRASKDWWAGQPAASTGMATDTSATAGPPMEPAAPDPMASKPDMAVNPPGMMPPPSSMPSTPPTLPESTSPAPGSNLPGALPPTMPPKPQ